MEIWSANIPSNCIQAEVSVTKLLGQIFTALAVFLIPAQALAKWPERTITIVSPFGAGGTADLLARLLGEEFEKRLGQTVIVENKTGAGGAIGAAYVARAEPDGYVLLMGSIATHAMGPAVKKSMPYDPVGDFVPVILVAEIPNLLIVKPSLPVTTIPELIEYAKKAEKPLTYASAGAGTSQHLGAELFIRKTGVKMTHVPYKGAGEVVKAVISGEVDLTFNNFPASWAAARDGQQVRAVAVTSLARSPFAPDVPAVSETLDGFEAGAWFGLFAPKGTDAAIVKQLASMTKEILEAPAVADKLKAQGAVANPLAEDKMSSFVAQELKKWKEVASESGISME